MFFYFYKSRLWRDFFSYQRERTRLQLEVIQNKIDEVVALIENEPVVQWCRDGRDVPGLKRPAGVTKTPRYPGITNQVRIRVSNSLMNTARDNYQNKYNNLMEQMTTDYGNLGRRIADLDKSITEQSRKSIRRESAQRACLALADMTLLPKSPTPPTGNPTKWIVIAIVIAAIIVASVFTFGGAAIGAAAGIAAATGAGAGTAAGSAAITVTATAAATGSSIGSAVAAGSGIAASMAAGSIIPVSTTVLTTVATTAATTTAALSTAATVLGTVGAVGAVAMGAGELGAHSKEIRVTSGDVELPLTHTAKMEQWNFKETITTTFDPNSFVCTKCSVTQECEKDKNPVFGDRGCKKWKSESEKQCEEIQM